MAAATPAATVATRRLVSEQGRELLGQGAGPFLGVDDRVGVPLLGEEPLPVRGELRVHGVPRHHRVEVRRAPVALGPHDPAEAQKIMHGQLDAPNGMTLMVSDGPAGMPIPDESNISVSLSGDDDATLRGYWNGLAAGGQPIIPLEKAPWGDAFGMLIDKFGVSWMVNIAGQQG